MIVRTNVQTLLWRAHCAPVLAGSKPKAPFSVAVMTKRIALDKRTLHSPLAVEEINDLLDTAFSSSSPSDKQIAAVSRLHNEVTFNVFGGTHTLSAWRKVMALCNERTLHENESLYSEAEKQITKVCSLSRLPAGGDMLYVLYACAHDRCDVHSNVIG